jgi:hypothetical protein
MRQTKGTSGDLTEAQAAQGYTVVILGAYPTESNSRVIPYVDVYQGRSSVMETPAQNLQKAADEEQMRTRKRQSKKDEQEA